jgi:Uma2 family endonuclease
MSAQARVVTVDGDRLQIPAWALDHEGLRRWATSDAFPEKVRVGFIDGEVLLDMSPEEAETHNKLKLCVAAVISRVVEDEDLGEVFADGMFLTHEQAGLSTEPDLTFVSWDAFQSQRVRRTSKANRRDRCVELVGTPDLVVEIVSDSSVRKDTRLLRKAYLAAEIPEYWLIDARGEEIRFEILQNDGSEFRASAPADQPQVSQVLRRRWILTRELNRAGRYRYRLTSQP